MNNAQKKPNNPPPVPMSRAQALCHLWTIALQKPKERADLCNAGALTVAVAACKPDAPQTDRAAGVGLVCALADDPALCERVLEAKALPQALQLTASGSSTAQAAAFGAVRALVECPATRDATAKRVVKHGWDPIVALFQSDEPRLDAKADGARILLELARRGDGADGGARAIRADLFERTRAADYMLDLACERDAERKKNRAAKQTSSENNLRRSPPVPAARDPADLEPLRTVAAEFLEATSGDPETKAWLCEDPETPSARSRLASLVRATRSPHASLARRAACAKTLYNVLDLYEKVEPPAKVEPAGAEGAGAPTPPTRRRRRARRRRRPGTGTATRTTGRTTTKRTPPLFPPPRSRFSPAGSATRSRISRTRARRSGRAWSASSPRGV